jgi:carboxyl-terminal processing protease
MKSSLAIIFLTLIVSGQTWGQTPPVAAVSATPTDVRRETFEQVWRTVRDKHFDPTLGGLDWNKIHEKYEPRLTTIKTDGELYAMLQEMIGELGQSHFNIIPPTAVVEESNAAATAEGEAGIDLQIINGEALITAVKVGSAASISGLRPGYVLRAIDGKPMAEFLASLEERLKSRRETDELKRLIMSRLVLRRVDGAAGTAVALQVLDEKDQLREIKIVRSELKTEMSPAFGNFPPQHVVFESRRLESGIAYIRFNIWVMPQMEKLRTAIRALGDASGLILDLRGNPGGIGGMAGALSGMLTKEQFSLGTMKMRSGEIYFTAFPQPQAFLGPVIILTDAGSASTSEVFAAGMQETKRATVVGERTAGAALPSVFEKLPTGAIFQYAVGDFKTPGGVLVEARGVIPDVPVQLTRASLLAGHDLQMDAAVYEIKLRTPPAGGTRRF